MIVKGLMASACFFACVAWQVVVDANTPVAAGTISGPTATAKNPFDDAVHALESAEFAQREAASKRLLNVGKAAIPALLSVAKEGSLEATIRAVGILETIYVEAYERLAAAEDEFAEAAFPESLLLADRAIEDARTADAAELALDELGRAGGPSAANRANIILETHDDIRESRAIAEIERLKGKTRFVQTNEGVRPNPLLPAFDRTRASARGRGELEFVVIGPKWKGGDDGLKQVARLKRLHLLYRIEGAPVSDAAIARLRAEIPGLEVMVRGAAKLGIQHSIAEAADGRGCLIKDVEKGEAADNAGLHKNDVIVRFAGGPVENFSTLIDLLRNYKPGDQIDTTVIRDELPMRFRLTLTGWD